MNTFVTTLPQARAGGLVMRARRVLTAFGQSIWRAMQESGRARGRAELLNLADACERSQPNLARELRSAAAYDPLA